MNKKIAVTIALLSVTVFSIAQTLIGRQQVITFHSSPAANLANALIWLPADYSQSGQRYPLIIFLHGKMETGNTVPDLNRLTFTGLPMWIAQGFDPSGKDRNGKSVQFIVVSPQNSNAASWSYGYPAIKYLLQDVLKNYRVDPDRIYITGLSAGGWGAWTAITDDSSFCKKIAAIIPVSAAPLEHMRSLHIGNAAKYGTAVWSICGTQDPVWHFAVDYTEKINEDHPLIPARLTGISGQTHTSAVWDRVYDPSWKNNKESIYDWLLRFHRGSAVNTALSEASQSGKEPAITYDTITPGRGRRRYPVKSPDNGIYLTPANFSYAPGDTIVLRAAQNPYAYVYLKNIYGKAGSPVTVINEGGTVLISSAQAVSMGFKVENCRFINITGNGSPGNSYGFKVAEVAAAGVGAEVTGRSSNIEISHLFIHHKSYGFWVKQEASCIDSLQYPNWTIHDISIHDNQILGMGQEGMYLGSTDPNGTRAKNCNGQAIFPKPLRLGNIRIYNNIIDSTNRGGIQLSGADYGENEIYNNHITHIGFEYNTQQGNGIVLGGYTHADIHNNYVRDTYTAGIFSLGSNTVRIENNIIDSSGMLAGYRVPGSSGIMIDTRLTNPVEKSYVIIQNNHIGKNTDFGIRFFKTYDTYLPGNIICNNTGTLKVAAGISWTNKCPLP